MTDTMTLSVTPLSDALGARIEGLDLSRPVSAGTFEDILHAWYRHLVLVFPDQSLSNEQHIEFSRRFGTLEIHPSRKHILKDYPEILLLTNRRDEDGNYVSLRDGGTVWHSDLSYMARPSLGSLLYSLDVPADGGDTEWANMYAAYEALPPALADRIQGLKAVHQFDQEANPRLNRPPDLADGDADTHTMWSKKTADVKARTPDSIHPVVRTHPETGKKALFVSRRFTIAMVDMDAAEGEALLLELFDYAERPANVYRHRWTRGELILWDNRCTTHLACAGVPDDQLRTMQRTTVRGEVPF
jgi:taurine dioxygenase